MTPRKPVLVTVTNEFGLGGVQLLHARVLPLLTDRYDVHLVGYRAKGILFDSLPDKGVKTHFLPNHGRFHVRTLWDYARFFTALRTDIVHSHGHSPNIFASLAGRLAGVPVRIGQIHSTGLHWYASSPLRRRKQALEESLVYRACMHKMVVISREMLNKSRQMLKLPDKAFALVHNGVPFPTPPATVPPEALLRQRFARQPGEILVGFVGRLVPEKGLDFLLDTMEVWVAAGLPVRLAIIGCGEAELVERWQQRAAAIGDGQRVLWLGEQADTHLYYPQFDAFVLTSDPGMEGMATVMLEAASHGLPILARRAAPEEEVRPYYSRLTFFEEHENPAAALTAALRLPPDASNAIRHFSIEAMAERLDALYTSLLSRERKSS